MGIETVCVGGYGGSAEVHIQLRNIFPGLGGVVKTEQDFVAACRLPRGVDLEYINNEKSDITIKDIDDPQTLAALNVFFRHTIAKKLDDYFFRTKRYKFAHVPRPLGSDAHGIYFYEWVHGMEGFYPEYYDKDWERWCPVTVDEWDAAAGSFSEAGVGFFDDIVENDGYFIKNVVMLEPRVSESEENLTKLWQRIDYGSESFHINFEKLGKFLTDNKTDLTTYLKEQRYEMLTLILKFLTSAPLSAPSSFPQIERLSSLVFDYRMATASHMGQLHFCHNSTFNSYHTKNIDYTEGRKIRDLSYTKQLTINKDYSVNMEIRSGFRSIDGIIYTAQEIPVSRICWRHGNSFYAGLDLFARHFLIKKLEDCFISAGYYSYPHIQRPIGSEGNAYYTEWVYGFAKCPKRMLFIDKPSDKKTGLDNWYEFMVYFADAGVDMRGKMKYVKSPHSDIEYARYIIVRQPVENEDPVYISRLWKRIGLDENTTPIDFDVLTDYMDKNKKFMFSHLTPNRYKTMQIMIKYLKGDMTKDDFTILKKLIHDYRISTLRHLNHSGFGLPPEGSTDLSVNTEFVF